MTNEWTLALIALIFAVIENDDDMIKNEWTHVKQMSPKSKATSYDCGGICIL